MNRTTRHILYLHIASMVALSSGCITDRLVDEPGPATGATTPGKTACDGGSCEVAPLDTEPQVGGTSLGPDGYLQGGYDLFFTADANWAPGAVTSIPDSSHTGWMSSRCFECHAASMVDEPLDHDPRMQYWPWSCARGFPGSSCHGHGVNGTPLFNHDFDPAFDNCTKAGCHDTNNSPKETENHGFKDAPDSFCNACHDWYWKEWPADPLAPSSQQYK